MQQDEALEMVRRMMHAELESRPRCRSDYNKVAEYHAIVHITVGVLVEAVLAMDRYGLADRAPSIVLDTWVALFDRDEQAHAGLREHGRRW